MCRNLANSMSLWSHGELKESCALLVYFSPTYPPMVWHMNQRGISLHVDMLPLQGAGEEKRKTERQTLSGGHSKAILVLKSFLMKALVQYIRSIIWKQEIKAITWKNMHWLHICNANTMQWLVCLSFNKTAVTRERGRKKIWMYHICFVHVHADKRIKGTRSSELLVAQPLFPVLQRDLCK